MSYRNLDTICRFWPSARLVRDGFARRDKAPSNRGSDFAAAWVTFSPGEQHPEEATDKLDSASVPISRAPTVQDSPDEFEQFVA